MTIIMEFLIIIEDNICESSLCYIERSLLIKERRKSRKLFVHFKKTMEKSEHLISKRTYKKIPNKNCMNPRT